LLRLGKLCYPRIMVFESYRGAESISFICNRAASSGLSQDVV